MNALTHRLDDLLEGLKDREPVRIDGLTTHVLPLDASGRLRIQVRDTVIRTLMHDDALDDSKTVRNGNIMNTPFRDFVLPQWGVMLTKENDGRLFCFIRGEGLVQDAVLRGDSVFEIKSDALSSTGSQIEGVAFRSPLVRAVVTDRFSFQNPAYRN